MGQIIRVDLEENSHDEDGDTYSVTDYIEWLQELLDKTPAPYKADLAIHINGSGSDGGGSASVSVFYDRPETEEEEKARIAKEAVWQQRSAARSEQEERATLARLLQKYGAP